MVLSVAWRNFSRQLYRFQVILVALMLGVAAMVVLIGVVTGMSTLVREKAAHYFAGDVNVLYVGVSRAIPQAPTIINALRQLPGFRNICWRTEYFGGDATLFFNGDSVRQRKLIGVNWKQEKEFFLTMDWRDGGPMAPGDKRGILVSSSTANRIHLKLGDRVTVSLRDRHGNGNTMDLTVRGIYTDNSFFSYASFVDQDALNAAMDYRSGTVTTLGAVLQPDRSAVEAGTALVESLHKKLAIHSLITDRSELRHLMSASGRPQVIVTTLDANLADIDNLLKAFTTVLMTACGLFLLILAIGVANTYRLIVFERTQEVGTMRALGVTRGRLMALFLTEAGFLGVFGLLGGILIGSGALFLATIPEWSGFSLAALFTENGHLVPRLPLVPLVVLVATLMLTTVAGVWIPARQAARLRPVDALREGE